MNAEDTEVPGERQRHKMENPFKLESKNQTSIVLLDRDMGIYLVIQLALF